MVCALLKQKPTKKEINLRNYIFISQLFYNVDVVAPTAIGSIIVQKTKTCCIKA
jgi:hypothetical protein